MDADDTCTEGREYDGQECDGQESMDIYKQNYEDSPLSDDRNEEMLSDNDDPFIFVDEPDGEQTKEDDTDSNQSSPNEELSKEEIQTFRLLWRTT